MDIYINWLCFHTFVFMKTYLPTLFILFCFLMIGKLSAQIPNCVQCCCGNPTNVGLPGGNFEDPPFANPIITYFAGQTYSTWTVVSGSIDVLGPNYLNWATGNPNGASQFIDLHGNTPGTMATTMTGLTVGDDYTIVLWYSKNAGVASANCQIQVAGGAWLDETWTATNNPAIPWLQKCFTFEAQSASAELRLTGSSPSQAQGMLLDDINLYKCPTKSIPMVNNPPDDISGIQCVSNIPPIPVLDIQDDCDNNPMVSFSSITVGTPCNEIITRTWVITNSCGKMVTIEQNINVEDTEAPTITKDPEDIVVDCTESIDDAFDAWLFINGDGVAEDNCNGIVIWSSDYDQEPTVPCSETLVTFLAEDNCGNTSSKTATFQVVDLLPPAFISPPIDVDLICANNPYDSLLSWVKLHAFAKVADNCGSVSWSHDYDGNKTNQNYTINFIATDECNNSLSYEATFKIIPGGSTNFLQKTSCNLQQIGLDTVVYKVNSCDSVVITNTIFSAADTLKIDGYTCKFSDAIKDTLVFKNQFGCDSLIFRNIKYIKPDTTILLNKSCFITTTSTDTITLQGQFCDSLILLKNISLASDTLMLQFNTCDTAKAGTFIANYFNADGCDSTVITKMTYAGFTYSNLTIDLCGNFANYKDTVSFSTPECDSFVFIQYQYHKLDTINLLQGTCDSNQIGTSMTILKNQWGCDSTIFLTLQLLSSDYVFLTGQTCNQNESGIFVTQYTNLNGCDSIVTLNNIFVKSDTSYVTLATCDTKLVGVFATSYPTKLCDSVVITNRVLSASSITSKNIESCLVTSISIDTIILQNNAGCDSLIITTSNPKPLEAHYILQFVSCKGLQDGLIVIDSVSFGTSPFSYSLNGINYGSSQVIDNLKAGSYLLNVTDSNGCLATITDLLIEDGEDFAIELGPDQTVEEGQSVQLAPYYSSTPQNIKWSPPSLFNCLNCPANTINIDQDVVIFLYAENESACPSNDSIFLKFVPKIDVYIPNAFSPDLNGINDYFTIYGDEHLVNIKELRIYSRWGENVFIGTDIEPNNSLLGWNGRFKGKLLNSGIFVFYAILEFDNNKSKLYKGEINLLR